MHFRIMAGKRKLADKTKVELRIRNRLSEVWRGAVGAFVEEAVKHVVIDTGMSAASFIPLAANIGLKNFAISSARQTKGWTDVNQIYHPKETKGIERGIKLGRKAYKLRFPGIFHSRSAKYIFEFDLVVFQYIVHESIGNKYGIGNSGNWQSLVHARQAFINYWNDNYPDEGEILAYLHDGDIT